MRKTFHEAMECAGKNPSQSAASRKVSSMDEINKIGNCADVDFQGVDDFRIADNFGREKAFRTICARYVYASVASQMHAKKLQRARLRTSSRRLVAIS